MQSYLYICNKRTSAFLNDQLENKFFYIYPLYKHAFPFSTGCTLVILGIGSSIHVKTLKKKMPYEHLL